MHKCNFKLLILHQDIGSGSQMKKGITDPYIMITGSFTNCEDCALICNRKIVFKLRAGYTFLNMILTLIAFCHLFVIEYQADVKETMEFLQEKLLGIVERRSHSTAYMNLFRSVTCLQEKIEVTEDKDCDGDHDDNDSDATVDFCDLETQLSVHW
jgi:hypothetical protein